MKKLLFIFIATFFISCRNIIKGKIEYRIDNKDCYGFDNKTYHSIEYEQFRDKIIETRTAYLINESLDKAYEFTIKVIESSDDTISNQFTTKIKLSPGEEKWIGCTRFLNGNRYHKIVSMDTFYKGDTKDYSIEDIVRIDKKEVDDSTSPKPRNLIAVKYLCTGQLLISNAEELFKDDGRDQRRYKLRNRFNGE